MHRSMQLRSCCIVYLFIKLIRYMNKYEYKFIHYSGHDSIGGAKGRDDKKAGMIKRQG